MLASHSMLEITDINKQNWFKLLDGVLDSDSYMASNHKCSTQSRQIINQGRTANFLLLWPHCFEDSRWILDTTDRNCPSPTKNSPITKIVFSGSSNECWPWGRDTFFSPFLSHSYAVPKSVTLRFICKKASVCKLAACLENTPCV